MGIILHNQSQLRLIRNSYLGNKIWMFLNSEAKANLVPCVALCVKNFSELNVLRNLNNVPKYYINKKWLWWNTNSWMPGRAICIFTVDAATRLRRMTLFVGWKLERDPQIYHGVSLWRKSNINSFKSLKSQTLTQLQCKGHGQKSPCCQRGVDVPFSPKLPHFFVGFDVDRVVKLHIINLSTMCNLMTIINNHFVRVMWFINVTVI